jgi:hypothetical protein
MAGCFTTIERLQREHPGRTGMAAAVSRDLHVRIEYGDLRITLLAEAVSYSPDALDDMRKQAMSMFREALDYANDIEHLIDDDEDDDTIADPFREGPDELITDNDVQVIEGD